MMLKLLQRRTSAGIIGNEAGPAADINVVRNKSIKISVLYFVIGCAWILLSEGFIHLNFPDHSEKVEMISVFKGVIFLSITSILYYRFIYRSIKRTFDIYKKLLSANVELEKSNSLYKELCQELDQKQLLLKSLVDSIPDIIFYKDPKSNYLGCNKAFEVFCGRPESEIVGKTDRELFDLHEAEKSRERDMEMMKTSCPIRYEKTINDPDGNQIYLEMLKTPYYDMDHNVIGLIGVSRDISERRKREEEIRYLSYHDVLTGLSNRTFFNEERKRVDTEGFYPLSVIYGDVNGMKLINDAFGYAEGDQVLTEIAQILKKCTRPGDTPARVGGDEFSILLPNTDNQTAKLIAEKIKLECERRHSEKNMLYLDIALGYATKDRESDSFNETMILAEGLMYRRKLLERKSLHSSIISSIKSTMYEKSNETEEHAERLAELSKKLGRVLGLCEDKIDELELVSTLHDIGKISIDRNILDKTDQLSEDDWREIKKHPEVGYRIANSTSELRHIADYILCHHERWDGKGYPQGLAGKEIPLVSRVISIVDAYDAMTQDRAYRKALPKEEAIAEITKNAGTQFDPEIAKVFIEKVIAFWEKENES